MAPAPFFCPTSGHIKPELIYVKSLQIDVSWRPGGVSLDGQVYLGENLFIFERKKGPNGPLVFPLMFSFFRE